jgi:hypothetical protein
MDVPEFSMCTMFLRFQDSEVNLAMLSQYLKVDDMR